jgi:hypothetical protein
MSSDFRLLTDEQLRKLTGKTWQTWCELLDSSGGRDKTLTAIAAYLIEQHRLRRLWAQMIAVYYKWQWCPRHGEKSD